MKLGNFLFVYGTLRRGEAADLSQGRAAYGAKFIEKDRINGEIYNLGWYPGVKLLPSLPPSSLFDSSGPTVTGDVFRITDESITPILDAYEGFPSLYNRHKVETENGFIAWVYTYNGVPTPDRLIPAGDWQMRNSSIPMTKSAA